MKKLTLISTGLLLIFSAFFFCPWAGFAYGLTDKDQAIKNTKVDLLSEAGVNDDKLFYEDSFMDGANKKPTTNGYFYIKPSQQKSNPSGSYINLTVFAPQDSLSNNTAFISIRDGDSITYIDNKLFDNIGQWTIDIGEYNVGNSDIIVNVISGSENRIYSMVKAFQKKKKIGIPSISFDCNDANEVINNSQEIANQVLSEGVSNIYKQSNGYFYSTEIGGSISFSGAVFDEYYLYAENSLYNDYRISYLESYTRWLNTNNDRSVFYSAIDFEYPFDDLVSIIDVEDVDNSLVNYNDIFNSLNYSDYMLGVSLYLKDPGIGTVMTLNRNFDNLDSFYYDSKIKFATSVVASLGLVDNYSRITLFGRGDIKNGENIEIFKSRFKPRVMNASNYAESGYYGKYIDLSDERSRGMLFGVWMDNFGITYQASFPEESGSLSLVYPDGEESLARNSNWYLNCLDYPDFPMMETFPCDQYGMYSINWTLNNDYFITSSRVDGEIDFDGISWGEFRRSLIGSILQRIQSVITKK